MPFKVLILLTLGLLFDFNICCLVIFASHLPTFIPPSILPCFHSQLFSNPNPQILNTPILFCPLYDICFL